MLKFPVISEERRGDVLARVIVDQCPESPRECQDNFSTLCLFHNRHTFPNEGDIEPSEFNGWDEMEEFIKKEKGAYIILPVFMYEHGGIIIRAGDGFACPWDSGQIGFVFCTADDIRKNWMVSSINRTLKDRAERLMIDEVKEYSQYVSGEVYGYSIVKITTCGECGAESEEELEYCWGFYGDEAIGEAVQYTLDLFA